MTMFRHHLLANLITLNLNGDEQKTVRRQFHQTIQQVTHEMGVRLIFNTAIAANMELINTISKFTDESDNGKAIRQELLEAVG